MFGISMATPTVLWYQIIGEETPTSIRFNTLDSLTVDDLKKAIRTDARLNEAPHRLELRKVSISFEPKAERDVKIHQAIVHPPLKAYEQLSKIFSDVQEDCLHVIVKRPAGESSLTNSPQSNGVTFFST